MPLQAFLDKYGVIASPVKEADIIWLHDGLLTLQANRSAIMTTESVYELQAVIREVNLYEEEAELGSYMQIRSSPFIEIVPGKMAMRWDLVSRITRVHAIEEEESIAGIFVDSDLLPVYTWPTKNIQSVKRKINAIQSCSS